MVDLIGGDSPFVAFVGAGASSLPPSHLPTWTEFNNLLLESLCEGLATFSGNRQPTDQLLSMFRERRDQTHFFAPDFQAQLMEGEIGSDYFRVWQSLEAETVGPVHMGLAELASRGRLAAIITVNFDRLIETALRESGQAFEVFHDADSFEKLAGRLTNSTEAALPVLKIHGSIEDPASLVDTLRQRLIGRPSSLTEALQSLLRSHPWLYLGFSGADFSYNPNYLGVLNAAADAKGFVFLAREGSPVKEGVRVLADEYGGKASIEFGDLANWLTHKFKLSIPTLVAAGTPPPVKERIREWAADLGPMAIVNILTALMKSLGMDAHALWLARKTWKSYRTPEEAKGPSYARYNYNYGCSLLEVGFIENPIVLEDDKSNLLDWKRHADSNAFEFLARAYDSGKLTCAGAHLAAVLAYRGEVGKAIALAAKVTDEILTQPPGLDLVDIALASVPIYDIMRVFDPAAAQLTECLEITRTLGDEPRRARVCTQLGRFLTYGGHFEEADRYLSEAETIARRLDLGSIEIACQAARGRWLTDSGQSDQAAIQILQGVAATVRNLDDVPLFMKEDIFQPDVKPTKVTGRRPILCRILLDLNRSALFAGNADIVNQTLNELDELTVEVFFGYCPLYLLAAVECSLTLGSDDQRAQAPDLIERARRIGKISENPWVDGAADHLQQVSLRTN